MRKFILAMLLVVGLAGLTYAAVVIESNGTRVKKTETLNVVGAAVTAVSGEVTIDVNNMSGTLGTGSLRVVCVNTSGFLVASSTTVDCR